MLSIGIHMLAVGRTFKAILNIISSLVSAYYINQPDVTEISQKVVFSTSGHRRSSLKNIIYQLAINDYSKIVRTGVVILLLARPF
jgi:hypothetical protein